MPLFEIVRYQNEQELPRRWRFHAAEVEEARDEFARALHMLVPEADSAELYNDDGDLIDQGCAVAG